MTIQELIRFGFQLFRRTFLKGWLLNLVVFLPLYSLFGITARRLFLPVADVITSAGSDPDKAATALTLFMERNSELALGFQGSIFLLFVGIIWVTTATIILNWHGVIGEDESLGTVLRRSVGRPLLMAFVQSIIVMMFAGAAFIAISIVTLLLPPSIGTAVTVGAVSFLVAVTAFRVHEIVADDRGPWRGLISGIALARVNIARVFSFVIGIGLLLAVLASTIQMGVRLLQGGVTDSTPLDPKSAAAIATMLRMAAAELTPLNIVAQSILYSLTTVFFFSMLTALYTDMRARRGDFAPEDGEDVDDPELPDAYRPM